MPSTPLPRQADAAQAILDTGDQRLALKVPAARVQASVEAAIPL